MGAGVLKTAMEYGRRVGMKPPEAYGHRIQSLHTQTGFWDGGSCESCKAKPECSRAVQTGAAAKSRRAPASGRRVTLHVLSMRPRS